MARSAIQKRRANRDVQRRFRELTRGPRAVANVAMEGLDHLAGTLHRARRHEFWAALHMAAQARIDALNQDAT